MFWTNFVDDSVFSTNFVDGECGFPPKNVIDKVEFGLLELTLGKKVKCPSYYHVPVSIIG